MRKRVSRSFDMMVAMKALVRKASHTDPTTPAYPLPSEVKRFVYALNKDAKPVLLRFTMIDPAYAAGYCQVNVQNRVNTVGGSRVDGWMIWQSGAFVEAEFHSVWQDENGNLLDITPRKDGEAEVLFLPDPNTAITQIDGGDRTPSNRTNVAKCPYTLRGVPTPSRYYDRTYVEADRAYLSKFGLTTIAKP